MKPLHIPKNKKIRYLKVYCYQCKTDVNDLCKTSRRPIRQCKYGERHRFKIYFPDPENPKIRKTQTLETRDISEATKQTILIQDKLRSGRSINLSKKEVEESKHTIGRTDLLINAIAKYMASLHGEGVPAHKRKDVSIEHIRDNERAFNALIECLHKNGEEVQSYPVTKINDHTAGNYLDFLKHQRNYKNRTINKYVGNLKPFLKWFSKEFNTPINNWFGEIPKLPEKYSVEIMPKKYFDELIEGITKDRGTQHYSEGKKRERYFYKSYLKQALLWALHTGLRREELIQLKHSDVKDFGDFKMLEVENFKVNRIQKRNDESEKIYSSIPVTRMIEQLLNESNYEKFKNTDRYLIEPDLISNRVKTMKDGISRGFDHYFKLVQPESHLTFKSLRKTYLTGLDLYMNGQASSLTHSNRRVLDEHYIDKKEKAKKAVGFEVYSEEMDRKNELKQLREDSNTPTRNNDLEVPI